MPDLDLQVLVPAAVLLVRVFAGAGGALGGEPGSEEGGGVKGALEVADYLGGGEGGGLVDR